jgi:threonine dehydratase
VVILIMVSAQTGAIQEPFNLYSSISRRYVWEPNCVCAHRRPTAREPSAAVPYAAIDERVIDVSRKRVGIILTGRNVDLDALPWNL